MSVFPSLLPSRTQGILKGVGSAIEVKNRARTNGPAVSLDPGQRERCVHLPYPETDSAP